MKTVFIQTDWYSRYCHLDGIKSWIEIPTFNVHVFINVSPFRMPTLLLLEIWGKIQMKWHQFPVDVFKVSLNMPFLLSELLLWCSQSQSKSLMPFGAAYQLLPELDPLLIEETAGTCPGDSQPSSASLSCLLTVVWGDIKTHQQVKQWGSWLLTLI